MGNYYHTVTEQLFKRQRTFCSSGFDICGISYEETSNSERVQIVDSKSL